MDTKNEQLVSRHISIHSKTVLKCFNPISIYRSIQRKGCKETTLSAIRKASIVMKRVLIGPEVMRINPVGFVCNHRCPMCVIQNLAPEETAELKFLKRGRLILENYLELFDSVPGGLKEVNVTGGGEPLLHKDIVKIFLDIKRRRLRGTLISNGTVLSEPIARELVGMRWDKTRISIHGGDPKTYREIHGVDNFRIMVRNLYYFNRIRREQGVRKQVELEAFHVIQKGNIHSIDKLFEISEVIGADKITFDPIISLSDKTWMTAGELRGARDSLRVCARESSLPCNLDDIIRQLEVETLSTQGIKPFTPAKWCSVGFDQTYINSIGDVLPCSFSTEKMGNIKERSFTDIWKSKEYIDYRKRLSNGEFATHCIKNHCTHAGVLHN